MDKRTVSGLHNINADHITGITVTGNEIDNFEQYLLGVSRIVGVSSANLSSSIALINNEILNLSTSGLSTDNNLGLFDFRFGKFQNNVWN